MARISDSATLALGTTRLFAEQTASAWFETHRDHHGFLRPSSLFFGFERLLEKPCSLVLAPPWIGKSFTARKIDSYLRTTTSFHHLTDLEARLLGEPLKPGWWSEWEKSDDVATWVIDALDEGQRRDAATCPALLQILAGLSAQQRQRLRLLAFAREGDLREVAPNFGHDLREIFQDDLMPAELLSLDLDNARDAVEEAGFGSEGWAGALGLIERNSLQSVAGYPAALLFIARQPGDAQLSFRDVWKGVVQELLNEQGSYRAKKFQTQPEHRFAAAARLAAVLTFAGKEELASSVTSEQPTLPQIFSVPQPRYVLATREAAQEALRSGMFRATAEGHRFLHKNVREWMAAFGVAGMAGQPSLPLEKLRPILQNTPASGEAAATIRPELKDLTEQLAKVHDSPEVREWVQEALAGLPTDLFVQDLEHVRSLLDRLEQLAAHGGRPEWIDDEPTLRRLVVPGLGEDLAGRVRDDKRPKEVRIVLLRIGTVLGLDEVLSTAAGILSDSSQDEGLRSWCATSIRYANRPDLLQHLAPLVESAESITPVEREIVSTLTSALVEQRLWTAARAFRSIPRGRSGQVIDTFTALPYTLDQYMTVADAEEIVSEVDPSDIEGLSDAVEEQYLEGELSAEPRWQAYAAAAKMLASVKPVDPARLRRLIPFVLSLGNRTAHHESELIGALEGAFRSSEIARRALFEAAVEAEKTSKASERHVWWWIYRLLTPDDLGWLEGRLAVLAEGAPEISVALHLSERTSNQAIKRRVLKIARTNAPGTVFEYRKARAHQRKWEQQERQEREKEEAGKRYIEQLDREWISKPELSPQQRLWYLSWVNFSDQHFRPRNLVGSWADVPADLQQRVLNICADALDTVIPTRIPEGSSYPTVLQYEGQAFTTLLTLRPERFELTRERIERWLPAVLRTFDREKAALLEHCLRVEPEPTEQILLDAIARELREENAYSVLLQDLPASLWTEKVTRWVATGVEGSQRPEARARLLELLASRRPEEGLRVATSVLDNRPMKSILRINDDGLFIGEFEGLGGQALEILLALAPDEAWPRIEEGVALAGEALLEKLRGLTSNAREGLGVRWPTWPPERIVRLAALLFAAYPPEKDPPVRSGLVTTAFDLRQLRWRVLEHLVQSNAPGAPAALQAAKEIHPEARQYVEHLQASNEASALLAEPTIPSGGGISVADACRLLDEQYFRLIRSADDLLEVVVEDLGNLERDIGSDYVLLFVPTADGKAERRRHEEALQAYVLRRLQDRLPGKVLDRETQVKWGQRTDIRVIAPVVDRQELVQVVIETKWSDNSGTKRGVSTGLTAQLGKEYLLGEGLSQGVFLVGWTGQLGTWMSAGGAPPRERTATSLAEALRRQAEDFRREHPSINIRPVVWDLERAAQRPRRRSRRRSQAPALRPAN